MKKTSRNNIIFIVLAYILTISFVFMSYFYTLSYKVEGDTYQYFIAFNDIGKNPMPWSVEFITSTVMWLISYFGGDFRFFLFFCLLMWVPIVFCVVFSSKDNVFLIFVYVFFMSPLFMSNALFLIRQFHAALFFLVFVFFYYHQKGTRINSFLFVFLSVASHVSAIIWFLFFNDKVYKLLARPSRIFVMVLTVGFVFFLKIDVIMKAIDGFRWLFNWLGVSALDRKLAFYSTERINDIGALPHDFVFIALVIVFLSIFLLIKNRASGHFYFFVLTQALILVFFSENVVMANRLGFFSFYFCLPIVVFFMSMVFKRIRVSYNEV